jgi:thioredoxin 1
MLQLTTANIDEVLGGELPVAIDFGAAWCGPCKVVEPLMEELSKEYDGRIAIGKCDIEANNEIALKYGVRNIPTIIFVRGGQIVDKQVGATTKAKLDEKLQKLL